MHRVTHQLSVERSASAGLYGRDFARRDVAEGFHAINHFSCQRRDIGVRCILCWDIVHRRQPFWSEQFNKLGVVSEDEQQLCCGGVENRGVDELVHG